MRGLSSPFALPQTSSSLTVSDRETRPTRVRTGGSSVMSSPGGGGPGSPSILCWLEFSRHSCTINPNKVNVWLGVGSSFPRGSAGGAPRSQMRQHPHLTSSKGPQRPSRSLMAPGSVGTYITMRCQEQPWPLGPCPGISPGPWPGCPRLGMKTLHKPETHTSGFKPRPTTHQQRGSQTSSQSSSRACPPPRPLLIHTTTPAHGPQASDGQS